jgi:osmotically-inducible protein OsmY
MQDRPEDWRFQPQRDDRQNNAWRRGEMGRDANQYETSAEPFRTPMNRGSDGEQLGYSDDHGDSDYANERDRGRAFNPSMSYGQSRDFGEDQGYRETRGFVQGQDSRGRALRQPWGERSRGERVTYDFGEFVGKGPKGYRRSDNRILEDVQEALTQDGLVDATEIDVSVNDCEVTLTGTVVSRQQKRAAEDVTERVAGVRDINNQIRVAKESPSMQGSGAKDKSKAGAKTP